MPVGDKEAAVVACVNAALKARGYNPPYDTSQKMNGVPIYGYQPETMIMFHRKVRTCLAAKGYTYTYRETLAYMNQTLVMTLAEIYAAIDVKTTAPAPAGAAEVAFQPVSDGGVAPQRTTKKAAKAPRARAKPGRAGKKAAKKKAAKKKPASKKKTPGRAAAKKKKAAKRKGKRN
ncbi:MAG: hypothetical protein NTAFB05_19820 [Nitrobacter sp.]|uniref:hypothetical protein n=1 Tax=Nitrobacter sp. TaxID=29420 RepID=UPI00387DE9A4